MVTNKLYVFPHAICTKSLKRIPTKIIKQAVVKLNYALDKDRSLVRKQKSGYGFTVNVTSRSYRLYLPKGGDKWLLLSHAEYNRHIK